MSEYIYEFLQYMKIGDFCGHLQLISYHFIKSSFNRSILKKKPKLGFHRWVEKSDFMKNIKKYSTLSIL